MAQSWVGGVFLNHGIDRLFFLKFCRARNLHYYLMPTKTLSTMKSDCAFCNHHLSEDPLLLEYLDVDIKLTVLGYAIDSK